ncbi:triacylglycerol lipase [Oscillibacter sp. PC13]|uniref:alpha/beta hydrolase n=1 Tax=Oscillibacter sp. PC13 TaxID=1855299 RepID=UPI0008EE91FB|nr:triacylglycerol lipase [Oscillibacter sp. PC13]SFP73231.1 triacylglycerol lipase [Oscillibacter sp. PC13]
MKTVRRALHVLVILPACSVVWIFLLFGGGSLSWAAGILLAAAFVYINVRPIPKEAAPTRRIRQLAAGCELLRLFLITATINAVWMALLLPSVIRDANSGWFFAGLFQAIWFITAVTIVFAEAALFWNGMIRVYLTSVQLGLKHRVLAALCGWVPFLNIWYLRKIIRIVSDEVEFETEKWELDETRAESEICKTKYPLLLVHGVFFRDFRYVNYWGRIPKELKRNGATVFYGQQQSAASVEDSGRELAERIRQILEETGCEKVNIIAHSKGGLDSRAAIAHAGCASCVATLTTINTPHRGCIFAEYLLGKVPESARQKIAAAYNTALRRLGDTNPDFLAAVTDLTESACLARNETTPDAEGVLYESVMSYCKKAQHGKFPLNMTYPIVKHFDGLNDGLVSVDSARWGSAFTLLDPVGKRGISHGDVVDLNRENIPGFDVREFYVNLTAFLKARGY